MIYSEPLFRRKCEDIEWTSIYAQLMIWIRNMNFLTWRLEYLKFWIVVLSHTSLRSAAMEWSSDAGKATKGAGLVFQPLETRRFPPTLDAFPSVNRSARDSSREGQLWDFCGSLLFGVWSSAPTNTVKQHEILLHVKCAYRVPGNKFVWALREEVSKFM